jgi:hypothetical protein
MSLRFDQLIADTLRARVLLFPGFSGFSSGALHGLFGALNADEERFNHLYISKEPRAKFDGEEWTYIINENSIVVEATGGPTDEFAERVQQLLNATREHFKERRELRGMRVFIPDRVLLSALVPEDQHKDVGAIVRSKALGRIKAEHYALLPGDVRGAAIHITGETPTYQWDVTVAPSLARPDDLYVSAEVEFPWPDDFQALQSGDIAVVVGAIRTTADFLRDSAVSFAQGVLPESKPRKKNGDDDA